MPFSTSHHDYDDEHEIIFMPTPDHEWLDAVHVTRQKAGKEMTVSIFTRDASEIGAEKVAKKRKELEAVKTLFESQGKGGRAEAIEAKMNLGASSALCSI